MKKLFSILAGLMLTLNILAQTTIGSAATIKGRGIPGYIPMFKAATTLTNSEIYQVGNGFGSTVHVTGVKFNNSSINLSGTNNFHPGEITAKAIICPVNVTDEVRFWNSGFSKIHKSDNVYGISITTGNNEPVDITQGKLKITNISKSKPLTVGLVWDSLGYLKIVR